ncbi:Ser-Thr-rich glycosyl-phosphatidyl-inositol-anchored membrane family-domain-containing protein [Coniella lustricola]|uniref:Ser-Thr-rich glycosyl-phosphatidyl-inositol-anchored membrane family-domain-containing protein n=1 Tax=Coniella lustricola TaxID=2025994 RepID=A0A2T3AGY8_9PEZI|nr:Ser-Thr-rich glycosyl-phosphatidyl-inositol-anchored membrane family-domain-containing protein [Coniella lustricola]
MKFAFSAAAVLAFIGCAFAQATEGFDAITSPTNQEVLNAGNTYSITWDPTSSYNGQTVSIILLEGATQGTLVLGPTIAAGIDSAVGNFSWTVDSSVVGSALYGLKLQLDSNTSIFQYSFPFQIQGSTTVSTAQTSTSTTATTSSVSISAITSSLVPTTGVSSVTTQVTTTSSLPATTSTGRVSSATGDASTLTTVNKPSATGGASALTTVSKPSATGSAAASATPTYVTAGAAKYAAGSFAALGGVMAAVLAL